MKNKNLSTLINISMISVGMFLIAFASVPLYRAFCQITGIAGTTQVATQASNKILDREMEVLFTTTSDNNLPWEFSAQQTKQKIKIGETGLAFFKAKNISDKATKGMAVYNVAPLDVGGYFAKIECFCFEEQILQAGEEMTFPVSYYIDPEIAEEKNFDKLKTITLSYTFYKAKD